MQGQGWRRPQWSPSQRSCRWSITADRHHRQGAYRLAHHPADHPSAAQHAGHGGTHRQRRPAPGADQRQRDELEQLLNAVAAMSQNLRTMILKIPDGGQPGLHHLLGGNRHAATRPLLTQTQQAAAVETTANMEQLTATVKQEDADNAHHANQLATDASRDRAAEGWLSGKRGLTMQIFPAVRSVSPEITT